MDVLDRPLRWDGLIDGVDSVRLPSGPARLRSRLPVVIFDGDDTLWSTEHLYDEARDRTASVVAHLGLDRAQWDELQRRLDIENVARYGLSADRFPASCVQAFLELAAAIHVHPTEADVAAVRSAAASVFSARAPLADGVEDVLHALRESHRLILLTQGDPRVQAKRVQDSGLATLFDEIVVVATKSSDVLTAVVGHFDVDPSLSWMIGNSVPSDINPALAAGMRAIWIDAHVWDHERRETAAPSDRVVVADRIVDVLRIIRSAR